MPAIDHDWSERAEIVPVVDAVEWRDKRRDVWEEELWEEKEKIAVEMRVTWPSQALLMQSRGLGRRTAWTGTGAVVPSATVDKIMQRQMPLEFWSLSSPRHLVPYLPHAKSRCVRL